MFHHVGPSLYLLNKAKDYDATIPKGSSSSPLPGLVTDWEGGNPILH